MLQALADNLNQAAVYPTTQGKPELRQSIADWLTKRFALKHGSLDINGNIIPVNGTREALFSFTQALIARDPQGLVVSPNPFYQIYEGAAFLAGVEPHYLACDGNNGFIPDFSAVPADVWQRCQLLFICTPGNPTGAVIPLDTLQQLIKLADQYDFVIASDECYSEIYAPDGPAPVGLLQACAAMGRDDYARCVVFHSLSKRSNLPGLRSGFVAGDASMLKPYLTYRTYHGCAMPIHSQIASIAASAFPHMIGVPKIAQFLDVDGASRPASDNYYWIGIPSLSYLPATAIPIGETDAGLPVGAQIIGPEFGDKRCLRLAGLIEQAFRNFKAPPA